MRTLLLASALFMGLFGVGVLTATESPLPIPYHAFCKSIWLFATPCLQISTKLERQIQAFSPALGCADCHYTLVSVTPQYIQANHSSADGLTTERLIFRFYPTVMSGGCRVAAQSQSLAFSSLLDNGLNYCNLYSLLSASGLNIQPDFLELTNEWACLGYGLATCKP
ncbi:unnamed protein product [Knipowitschia caucasica]|uniref:Uncharacterized protein n=1 Tax=Knipowitschia caucasica TaxID=637954 RepID=A0AAV2JVQ3_KNICA